MANNKDSSEPIPKGSGKAEDIVENPTNFCQPWNAKYNPNITRNANNNEDNFLSSFIEGNKNLSIPFLFFNYT